MTSLWQAFIMISLCMHSARYHYGMQSRWYHYNKHSSWYHYDMHSTLWRDKIRPFTHHDIVTDYHISMACTGSCYCMPHGWWRGMHSPWFGRGMLQFPAAKAGSRAPVEKMKTTEKQAVNRGSSSARGSQRWSFHFFLAPKTTTAAGRIYS